MRVGALSLWRRANFKAGGRTLCGDCACRIVLAVAPCEFQISPTNPLRRLCVSNRSRCGAVRISKLAHEPSAEIVRVGSLSLWRRAFFFRGPRTLCGDCACRIALAVAPCEFQISRTNPLRTLCVSNRSRCGAVREPSAEIVRVESLSLWRRANFKARRRTLCGDCACRIALAVAPCESQSSRTNPLRRLCVSDRSRCGAVRTFYVADKPSAEIVRVESLSLWRRANFILADVPSAEIVRVESLSLWRRAHVKARRRTLCGDLCVSDRFRCGFRKISVQK